MLIANGLGLLTKAGWVFKDIDITLWPASVAAGGRRVRNGLVMPAARPVRTDGHQYREPDLEQLLIATSRTFALAIPLLPEPTRREVTISYLLFRVADTFEDAASWPRALRIEALERFDQLLENPGPRGDRGGRPPLGRGGARASSPATGSCWPRLPCVLDAFFALDSGGRRR